MNYPLLSEYIEAIKSAEDNFNELSNLRPVLNDAGQPGGLYLLDEPENSLSAEMQLQLVQYIHGMARFYDCQFIMSTHSPFILSLPFARIYNMDEVPVKTCRWTELQNVRMYYNFFRAHRNEFEETINYEKDTFP